MLDNGIFINDIKIKCNMFNSYFQNQCTIVETSSILLPIVKKTLLSLNKISFLKIKSLPLKEKYNRKNLMDMMAFLLAYLSYVMPPLPYLYT